MAPDKARRPARRHRVLALVSVARLAREEGDEERALRCEQAAAAID